MRNGVKGGIVVVLGLALTNRLSLDTNLVVAGLVVIAAIMFSDTFMGSVDMASASMRYIYDKATNQSNVLFNKNMEEYYNHLKRQHRDYREINNMNYKRVQSSINLANATNVNDSDNEADDDKALTTSKSTSDLTEYLDIEKKYQEIKNLKVGGLYNEGNTCFMNSVVQSLASLDYLRKFLSENEQVDGSMSTALDRLITKLNEKLPSKHTYSTSELIKSMGQASRWNGYDQEDAQEFFQEVLLGLERDVKGHTQQETNGKQEAAKIVTPFDGMLSTRVGCLTCGEMEGIRQGVVSSIDLSLQGVESNSSNLTVEDLLQDYCSMERISGVECYRCSLMQCHEDLTARAQREKFEKVRKLYEVRVNELADALKEPIINEARYKKLKPQTIKTLSSKSKQHMFSWPMSDIIMIHINRSVFDPNTGYSRKNYSLVNFPVYLDMSRYILDESIENNDPRIEMISSHKDNKLGFWYMIKAVVIHYGSHNFGHYVCFRKCDEGFWWRISDHSVELATEAQVLRSQGVFMLFYERLSQYKALSKFRRMMIDDDNELHEETDITEMTKL